MIGIAGILPINWYVYKLKYKYIERTIWQIIEKALDMASNQYLIYQFEFRWKWMFHCYFDQNTEQIPVFEMLINFGIISGTQHTQIDILPHKLICDKDGGVSSILFLFGFALDLYI